MGWEVVLRDGIFTTAFTPFDSSDSLNALNNWVERCLVAFELLYVCETYTTVYRPYKHKHTKSTNDALVLEWINTLTINHTSLINSQHGLGTVSLDCGCCLPIGVPASLIDQRQTSKRRKRVLK